MRFPSGWPHQEPLIGVPATSEVMLGRRVSWAKSSPAASRASSAWRTAGSPAPLSIGGRYTPPSTGTGPMSLLRDLYRPSMTLLTDLYQLTMAAAARAAGRADRHRARGLLS